MEAVQVSEHTDDTRKAVHLHDVDELEGLELEAEGGVDHDEDEVRDLGQVEHRGHVLGALDDGHAPLPTADERYRAAHLQQPLPRVVLHQRVDQRRLADAGWALHDHHEGRRDIRVLVKLPHMLSLGLLLKRVPHASLDTPLAAREGVRLRVVPLYLSILVLLLLRLLPGNPLL
eukprot:CAMPEP_0183476434 /NCGR_PEP_ID=MMETSP0370-20130417/166432_1 /TAXON_ID=268820 /ORGANISM="Peridinium aciculiferum, Strain PAER-2" /LENGTH=173 /DNA_ID=CAMNT_0025669277 /DNA_START=246 /DNA_END=764 /DNA_ORIENTATION=-